MPKILEKIKNLFSGKFVYKPKCCTKKEEPKPQQDEPEQHQEEPEMEQKSEE